jgi:hypothetical protein
MTTLQSTTCGLSKSHEMGRAVATALKQATLLFNLDSLVAFSLHSSIAHSVGRQVAKIQVLPEYLPAKTTQVPT